ncbi:S26 family signal peptidase [Maridesulfovibrio ferrireducens]|uniref:S26 family signal peptidase n=1 Tax=Maridesulfovibrio ferrireducens TaxID=246191 RepID=UPI001A335A80|nr:S26 family signal peptidase [Maridesulfovibrio ferrireducens]MBI9112360.1 S26 family signal peptidase [Maridesulfovibrio ferrireducens]
MTRSPSFIEKLKAHFADFNENRKFMKEFRKENRKKRWKENPIDFLQDYLFIAFCLGALLTILFIACGFRLSLYDSIPRGIYKISSETPKKGDAVLVSLCRCNDYYPLHDRAYTQGNFVRYFAAHAGDNISISNEGISINSKLWANSKINKKDSHNREMFSLLHSGTIPKGKALLLAKDYESSFDSRFFGLVPIHILQKFIPIFTF